MKQHELTEQGQVTDRYTKAVEQLGKAGPENLHSRLGAVYALERLGRDSPRDQTTVLEVLSAFIRTTAQGVPDDSPARREKCGVTTVDVRAALTVLGRRDPRQDRGFTIDLRRLCLAGVNLSRVLLAEADLFRVRADEARFVDASMSNAVLRLALLERTDFTDADLFAADLTEAYLGKATLSSASFYDTDLRGARLHDTKHDDTIVHGAVTNERTEGVWW
ncbi:pentapeptide repeat-containing protein [Lentzea sp. JNUCC 0626]|uniref:pentapeptide repeat-containing protein n=1 Tax=Lentzea sp. JNUCC 0626 TaxID=3367513 RepID=UPI003747C404